MNTASFGALLRQWRDRLSPDDAGITAGVGRRAPGLRREELAQLTGLSVDYILRLEQSRAVNPSSQVVGALARTLQLSRTERDQLYRTAGLLPPQDGTISTHVPPGVQRLAARLGDFPIAVFAADWTLLWCNDMWRALHGDPAALPLPERNLARALFGDGPAHAALHNTRSTNGPEAFPAAIVADLKDAVSHYPSDTGLATLITDLRDTSELFAHLWRSAPMVAHASERKIIDHPLVGELTLDCDVLTVPGADLRLVTYTTTAAGTDAGKLDLLKVTGGHSITASPTHGQKTP